MNKFLDPLVMQEGKPGEWGMVLRMRYRDEERDLVITVPAGFITDLASIPRPAKAIFDPNGRTRKPAVLHDWLYRAKPFSRSEADLIFLEAMKAEKVGWFERWVFWVGVRIGGWVAWNNY